MKSSYWKYTILEKGLLRLKKVMAYKSQKNSEIEHSQGPFLSKVLHQVRITGEMGDSVRYTKHIMTAESIHHHQCWGEFSSVARVI